ncbi:hypothetical protein QL285_064865 [Trifolium repens]|nr:hypothetical protein QL285_064865 [Trifolium repens]
MRLSSLSVSSVGRVRILRMNGRCMLLYAWNIEPYFTARFVHFMHRLLLSLFHPIKCKGFVPLDHLHLCSHLVTCFSFPASKVGI